MWSCAGKVRLTLLNLQLAGLTCPTVAHLGAGVFSTVKEGTTRLVTPENCTLATAHWLTAKLWFYQYHGIKTTQEAIS